MNKLAFRQSESLRVAARLFKEVFSGKVTKIGIAMLALVEALCCVIFDTPLTPVGEPLDLSGYELVFEDEFEGDELDLDVWKYRVQGKRRGGFFNKSQIQQRDGNLVITAEYLEDGAYGAGWYAGDVALNKRYKQGYFEVRAICNGAPGFWSAFWLQASHPYEAAYSQGGVGGCEIDIIESSYEGSLLLDGCVNTTLHCAGVDGVQEGFQSRILGSYKGNNIFEEYNTYGLKWTEDEYIFYINGVESCRSSFGNGVSQVEEDVILSLCVPESDKLDELDKETYHSEFIIDYIRIYQ